MPETKEQTIRGLCASWLEAAIQPGGGIAIGTATERYRLHRNGIQFHELNYPEMQAACTGLSRVLLLGRMNTIIDLDHLLFWAWSGEVLASVESRLFSQDEQELRSLLETCIGASLAGGGPPIRSHEEWIIWTKQKDACDLIFPNTRRLTENSHIALAYLAFPLLEALVKKTCHQYVNYSGTVISPFDVTSPRGHIRRYIPDDPRTGKCSSLRDLLLLLHRIANEDLLPHINDMREFFHSLDDSVDAFDQIYAWRNQSLHGQTGFQTIGGAMLNFSILISLSHISSDYERQRDRAWVRVRSDIESFNLSGRRSPFRYYPPF